MKRLATVLVAVAALASPATAGAASAEVSAGTLAYRGGAEPNLVYVLYSGGIYTVGDNGGTPITVGPGCSNPENDNTVTCSAAVTRLEFFLGGGDDSFDGALSASMPFLSGVSVLRGDDGDDNLRGTNSRDNLLGEGGDDTLDGAGADDWFFGGDGDGDTVTYANASGPVTVNLTPGTNTDGVGGGTEGDDANRDGTVENVEGSGHADVLTGAGGDNAFYGGAGDDQISAGGGNDTLLGESGADILAGGPDSDIVSYERASAAVRVDLADPGADGAAGENDTLTGFERVRGGDGDDTLIGDDAPNSLRGGPGDDVLDGGLGGDEVDGGPGTDTVSYATRTALLKIDLRPGGEPSGQPGESDLLVDLEDAVGGSGNDTLNGNDRRNVLTGGAGGDFIVGFGGDDDLRGGSGGDFIAAGVGDDVVRGDEGEDILTAGPGDDLLRARDGAKDSAGCDDGFDTLIGDGIDVSEGCESADVGATAPAAPPAAPPADSAKPKVTVGRIGAKALKRTAFLKGLPLTLSCDEACSWDVELRGSARSVRLARYEVTLASATAARAAGRRKLTLKPSRKLVGRARKLTVQLRITATDAAGNRTTVLRVLKVK